MLARTRRRFVRCLSRARASKIFYPKTQSGGFANLLTLSGGIDGKSRFRNCTSRAVNIHLLCSHSTSICCVHWCCANPRFCAQLLASMTSCYALPPLFSVFPARLFCRRFENVRAASAAVAALGSRARPSTAASCGGWWRSARRTLAYICVVVVASRVKAVSRRASTHGMPHTPRDNICWLSRQRAPTAVGDSCLSGGSSSARSFARSNDAGSLSVSIDSRTGCSACGKRSAPTHYVHMHRTS